MKVENVKPPVVKVDINLANEAVWVGRSLGRHIHDLERLLMIDCDSPATFDSIPLREAKMRSKTLVDGFTKSFQLNPDLKPMVQRLGAALMNDRKERLNLLDSDVPQMQGNVQSVTKQVIVKQPHWHN